jgi:hypothetical protein
MKSEGAEAPKLAEATRNLNLNCHSDDSKMQELAHLISKI